MKTFVFGSRDLEGLLVHQGDMSCGPEGHLKGALDSMLKQGIFPELPDAAAKFLQKWVLSCLMLKDWHGYSLEVLRDYEHGDVSTDLAYAETICFVREEDGQTGFFLRDGFVLLLADQFQIDEGSSEPEALEYDPDLDIDD